MESFEQKQLVYPHPEGLSRPEAMRHETGPVMTLVSMYVLRCAAERISSGSDMPAINDLAPDTLTAAKFQLEDILEDAYEYIAEESQLLNTVPALQRGRRTHYRPLFYCFYSEGKDALPKHIEDGFTPQLGLTNSLLLPGYIYAKHGTLAHPESHAPEYLAATLESQAFQDLLVQVSKTGNQLWKNGRSERFSADVLSRAFFHDISLLQPAERQFVEEVCALHKELHGSEDIPDDLRHISINLTNICTRKNDGTATISPYARKYLKAYLRMHNAIGADKELGKLALSKIDCSTKTNGCPVTIKSGRFPFHLIPFEVLQAHFDARTEEDGTITVPDIMTISSEGEYKYTNASPAVLFLNRLYADRIRNIAA